MLCGPACVAHLKDAVKERKRADAVWALCVTQVDFNGNSDTHFPGGISEQWLA